MDQIFYSSKIDYISYVSKSIVNLIDTKFKAMEKIQKETCIKFEERRKNQHEELVSSIISNMPFGMVTI